MSWMSLLTLTDQKFLSLALSSLWKLIPGLAGFIWRSKAVVFTAFCSSPVSLARLSVKVSAMRNSIKSSGSCPVPIDQQGKCSIGLRELLLNNRLPHPDNHFPEPIQADWIDERASMRQIRQQRPESKEPAVSALPAGFYS